MMEGERSKLYIIVGQEFAVDVPGDTVDLARVHISPEKK